MTALRAGKDKPMQRTGAFRQLSRSLGPVLRRTVTELRDDEVTDRAAALTYYGVLSVFPALVALLSVVSLLGTSAQHTLESNLRSFTPGPAKDIVSHAVDELSKGRSSSGLLLAVGILGALWAASGYIAAFMRAANAIWDVPEGRPVWKTLPVRLGVTFVVVVLLAATVFSVVITGSVADRVGRLLGVEGTAVTVWDIAKWPVLFVLAGGIVALLYWACPNVKHPGFRWLTPGGLAAVLLTVVASAGFAAYVAGFGSYNKTYGSVAGVVVFLVWLWLTNVALLFGAELDAELERSRFIAEGHSPDEEPYIDLRQAPAPSKS